MKVLFFTVLNYFFTLNQMQCLKNYNKEKVTKIEILHSYEDLKERLFDKQTKRFDLSNLEISFPSNKKTSSRQSTSYNSRKFDYKSICFTNQKIIVDERHLWNTKTEIQKKKNQEANRSAQKQSKTKHSGIWEVLWSPFSWMFKQYKSIGKKKNSSDILKGDPDPPVEFLKPGAYLVATQNSLKTIKSRLLVWMFEFFSKFKVPFDVDTNEIKISNVLVTLMELKDKDLLYALNPEDNSVTLTAYNVKLFLTGDIHVNKYITIDGTLEADVYVEKFEIKVFIIDEPGKLIMYPYIKFEMQSMFVRRDKLAVRLNMPYIPNWLTQMVVAFVKDNLVDQAISFLFDYAKGDAEHDFNNIIHDNYPSDITVINNDITFSLLLTNAPRVFGDYVTLPLDAMVWSKSQGRPARPVPSPIFARKPISGNIGGTMSSESLASLIYTFILYEHKDQFTINLGSGNMLLSFNLKEDQLQIQGSQAFAPDLEMDINMDFGDGKSLVTSVKADFGFIMNYLDFDAGKVNLSVTSLVVKEHTLVSSFDFINDNKLYFMNMIVSSIRILKGYTIRFDHVDLPLYLYFKRIIFLFGSGQMLGESNLSFYG